MIDVQLGSQSVPVQIFNTTLGGVRALSDAATAVDIDSRARKTANLSDLADTDAARENINAASNDTARSGTVQNAFDLLGAPPAVLSSRFYLTNALNTAEITDVATQAGTIDLSAKMNALVSEAEGREIYLPQGGVVNLSGGGIIYEPDYVVTGQKYAGLKIFGDSGTTLKGPAGGFAIDIDTGVSFKFQDRIYLAGFDIDCAGQAGAQGIRAKRAYRALIENMNINAPRGDGVFIQVPSNDADSSNNWEIVRLNVTDASGWAFHHEPFPGQNDLSYLLMRNCLFNSCGRDERKAITGITKANPGVVSCTAHGFTNGQKIRIGGVKGMFEVNTAFVFTVTVINANSFSIGVDTSSFGSYTSGGHAFPQTPSSGGVKMAPQESRLVQVACTETKNMAFMVGTKDSQALQTVIDQCTSENTTGIGFGVLGASGLDMRSIDSRVNGSVAQTHAHILFDATDRSITGVDIREAQFTAVDGDAPIVANLPAKAFEAVGANLGRINIEPSDFYAWTLSNLTKYGDGLFAATAPTVRDPSAGTMFEPGSALVTTFTTADPTYAADLRKAKKHTIVLATGASGTLTLPPPVSTGLAGSGPLNGSELQILIANNTASTINLSWGFATKSAPTTIAAGAQVSGHWRYVNAVGWVQSAAWI